MCQRWTGSVVATGTIVKKHEFKITKGEPTFFESSHYAERGFCTNCGSPLIFRAVEEDWLAIQTGTFDIRKFRRQLPIMELRGESVG